MDFVTNTREDFPLSFSDHNPLKPSEPCKNHGFSLEELSNPSKRLFQTTHHDDDHHQLLQNGSNLNFQSFDDHNFTIQGSSSKPFFGVPNPCINPFEGYTNGFSEDFNSYPSSMPSASDSQNGIFMHGNFHGTSTRAISGYHPEIPGHSSSQPQLYPSLNFQEYGSASTTKLPADDQLPCRAEQTRQHHKRVGKKKRPLHVRKASKIQKKSNIIKGQWTPQEDRFIFISSLYLFLSLNYFTFFLV